MTTVLEVPLHAFEPAHLKGILKKYPQAVVRVQTDEPQAAASLGEDEFWKIIGELDWKQLENEAILAPAAAALSRFSADDIHRFHDILSEKLFVLDAKKYAMHSGENWEGDFFSPDEFLYARACVVANGKAFFERVVKNPKLMPKDKFFEALLYLPSRAWQLKTGQNDYRYLPAKWIETYSNAAGWEGAVSLKEQIMNGL